MLRMKGELGEVITDVSFLINQIYSTLSDEVAEVFRDELMKILTEKDAVVWTKSENEIEFANEVSVNADMIKRAQENLGGALDAD